MKIKNYQQQYMGDTISYSKLVSIIFKYLNKFRENPIVLSDILEERSYKYQDTTYYPNNDKHLQIQTHQGIQPVLQLISLVKMKNIFPKFNWSYELHCAANERAQNIAFSYIQKQSQQLPIEHFVNEYADWNGNLSEHILYGFCDPKQILCELLIDDGNHERQNRKQLMDPNMHYVGIGIHKHEKYQFIIVIILATQVEKKSFKDQYIREGEENVSGCGDNCSIY